MIRYVLAVLLAVAILALSMPAVDYVAAKNTDRHAESAISTIDEAATSLIAHEEVPPEGHPPSQRIVEVTIPGDSLTTHSINAFEIERISASASMARYQFEGRAERNQFIGAPIVEEVPDENRTVALGGSGPREFVLTLEADASGEPVIVLKRNPWTGQGDW